MNVSDTGTGTINDNDTATFSIDDVTVNEGDSTATFTGTSLDGLTLEGVNGFDGASTTEIVLSGVIPENGTPGIDQLRRVGSRHGSW